MKSVAQYDPRTGALLAVFPSLQTAAASIPGASSGNICKVCRGRTRSAYGFRWAYYSRKRVGIRHREELTT